MKVVYSYTNPINSEFIPTEVLYIGVYSMLQVIKLGGSVTLYSSEKLITKFKEIGLPVNEYKELNIDSDKYKLPFLAKLLAYSDQTEPFIHLDLDSVLFSKLPSIEYNDVVKFAHRDIKPGWGFDNLDGIYKAYFNPTFELSKTVGSEVFFNLRLSDIPNMGIVQVSNPEVFKIATDKALDIYWKNYKFFDEDWARGCLLEQGLVHKFTMDIDSNYHSRVYKAEHFIFPEHIFLFIDELNGSYTVREWYTHKNIMFNSLKELVDNYSFEHLPAVHFMGTSKYTDGVILIALKKLIKEFGIKKLEKIEYYFGTGSKEYLQTYKDIFL